MKTEDLDLFCKFLNNHKVLIVDTSAGSRVRLAGTMGELGVQRARISLAASFAEGEEMMRRLKPKLVICDYVLGPQSGLDLLQMQRDQNLSGNDDCVFILVTANSSQSAVARAAEEDVDTYILKPYTLDVLKASIVGAVLGKVFPTEYLKTIKAGKDLLFGGKPEEALQRFTAAIQLNEAPSLAHFYCAQARSMMNILSEAEGSYQEGLHLNKIHYKCLTGLFDLLSASGRNQEAYDIVKKVIHFFPANPKRMTAVLRLAIMTDHFEDMAGFYKTFTQIEPRDEEVVRYMCSALVVSGRYFLQKKQKTRALEAFDNAAISCAGQIHYIRYIVETLIEFDLEDRAETFFKRYQNYDQTSEITRTLEFLTYAKSDSPSVSLAKGRALVKAGVKHPLLYQTLIKACMKAGLEDSGENLAQFAAKTWPARARKFLSIAGLDGVELDVSLKNAA